MKDKGTDTKKVTIGSRFRELRENYNDRGMTQETCADLLQISLALYGRIENDRAVPSTAVLIAAADLFGVSIDFLLCRTDFRSGAGGEYISKVTGLSDSAIKTLSDYQNTAPIDKRIRESLLKDTTPAAVYNLLPNTISFLLQPEHCTPNGAGLLHLIGHYITSDDLYLSEDLPEVLQTANYNGSGISFDMTEVIRSAIPNMIIQRLHEYRSERLHHIKKP